jgi:hypothetical protein
LLVREPDDTARARLRCYLRTFSHLLLLVRFWVLRGSRGNAVKQHDDDDG